MIPTPEQLADTCDDCSECRDPANWTSCCAACHCADDAMRCPTCRTAPRMIRHDNDQ